MLINDEERTQFQLAIMDYWLGKLTLSLTLILNKVSDW